MEKLPANCKTMIFVLNREDPWQHDKCSVRGSKFIWMSYNQFPFHKQGRMIRYRSSRTICWTLALLCIVHLDISVSTIVRRPRTVHATQTHVYGSYFVPRIPADRIYAVLFLRFAPNLMHTRYTLVPIAKSSPCIIKMPQNLSASPPSAWNFVYCLIELVMLPPVVT